jgi:general secretion pathway protein J
VTGFKVSFYEQGEWKRPWQGKTIPKGVKIELEIDGLGLIERVFLLPGDGGSHKVVAPTSGDNGSGNGDGDSDSGGIPDDQR